MSRAQRRKKGSIFKVCILSEFEGRIAAPTPCGRHRHLNLRKAEELVQSGVCRWGLRWMDGDKPRNSVVFVGSKTWQTVIDADGFTTLQMISGGLRFLSTLRFMSLRSAECGPFSFDR
jgi:hypothetical protein